MKYEWRKQEKNLYLTKAKPVLLTIPAQKFISLTGVGNPNESEFAARVRTLYPVAYGLKATYKQYCRSNSLAFEDYVVFPLEGVWSLTEKGQQLDHLDKNEFSYDIMIRVPDFVPEELIEPTLRSVQEKKNLPLISEIEIKTFPEMDVAQILHVGSYDEEPESFAKINDEVRKNGKRRISKIHREIYLSDARRVEASRLKTILRYRIR